MNTFLQTLAHVPPPLAHIMVRALEEDIVSAAKAMAGASDARIIGQTQATYLSLSRIRDELLKHRNLP